MKKHFPRRTPTVLYPEAASRLLVSSSRCLVDHGSVILLCGHPMANQGRDEKMRLALVPPKPKEFVMAYLIGIGAARCTIRFKALSASGVVRFMVGGAT